mmetsp:Transcript_26839/g.37798  ORF Transcript_26839/g.37798 Transcript_26839/m.37798 type:complete len:575 (+) Transcript_26839:89-1813(+)
MSAPSPTTSSKPKAPSTNKQNPQSKDESLKKPPAAVNRDRGKNDKNVWVSRSQNGKGSGSPQNVNGGVSNSSSTDNIDIQSQNTDNYDKTLEQQVKDMSIQDPSKSDSAKKQQSSFKQGNRKSQEIQPQQIQSQKQQRSPPQKRKQNAQHSQQGTQNASAEEDQDQNHDTEKRTKGVGKVKLSLAEFHSTVPSRPEDETPNRVLWVGNLSPDTTSKDIEVHFSPFGTVENVRILPHKHCAFVNFEDEKHAREAKKQLNGTQLKNTTIVVNYRKSEPKQNTQNAPGNNSYNDNSIGRNDEYSSGVGTSPPALSPTMSFDSDGQPTIILNTPSRALWIGNVSNDITEDDLYQEFAQFGDIESIRMLRAKTCAFVNFYTEDSALKALHSMQGKVLANMPIKLNFGKLPSRTSKRQSQMEYQMPPMGIPPGYMMGQYMPPEYAYAMPYGMPPQVPYMPVDPYQMYYPQIHICEMCGTNPKEAFWIPCGHAGCHECVVKIQQEQSQNPEKGPLKCPYCQTPVQKFMEITFAPAYVPYAPQPQPPMQPQSPTVPSRAPANTSPVQSTPPQVHGTFPAQSQ